MKNPAQTLGILAFVAPLIVISWLPGVRRFAVEHNNASMFAWGAAAIVFFMFGLWYADLKLRYTVNTLAGAVLLCGFAVVFTVVYTWAINRFKPL
jgi:hypothetical protein